jgi:hypothetical protein
MQVCPFGEHSFYGALLMADQANVTEHSVQSTTQQVAGAPRVFHVNAGVSAFHRLQITGFRLSTDAPQGVFVQVRLPQGTAGFSDSFTTRVEVVNRDRIDLVIFRVDSRSNPSAQFRFDILVIE